MANCENCNAPFSPANRQQKYCSGKCRAEHSRKNRGVTGRVIGARKNKRGASLTIQFRDAEQAMNYYQRDVIIAPVQAAIFDRKTGEQK